MEIKQLPQPNDVMLYWGGKPLIEHMHLFSTSPRIGNTCAAACGLVLVSPSVSMGAPPPLEHRCKTCETAWQIEQTAIAGVVRKALHIPLWETSKEVKLVASTLAFELARVQREVDAVTNRLRAVTTIFE